MYVTYSRMLASPIVMGVAFIQWRWSGWTCAILFILASLTDWLDGYLARKYKSESAMGKFMDPIADKILVLGPLLALLYFDRIDPLMTFLFLGRDIFIGGLRSVAAANQVIIAAKPFGKWKTGLQMTGIPCLLVNDNLFGLLPLPQIGYWCLWMSVILSLISGIEYTYGYFVGRRQ